MDSPYRIHLFLCISLWLLSPTYGRAEDQTNADTSLEEPDQESKMNLFAQATKAKPVSPQRKASPKPRIYKAPPKPPRDPSFFSWFDESEELFTTAASTKAMNKISLNLSMEQIGPGLGLEYGYKFGQTLSLVLDLTSNSAQLNGQQKNETAESLSASTQAVFGFLSYQKSNLLFPSFGISLRSSSGKYGWKGPETFGAFSANLLTIESRLSSEWTFLERYYLGAHWIGVGFPIFGTLTVESTDGLEDITRFNTSTTPKDRIYQELKSQILLSYLTAYAGFVF